MTSRAVVRCFAALGVCLCSLLAGPAGAAVQVIAGPTPILEGSASAVGDITVVNEKLAFALAVTSPVPYGVPRGALVDIAPVIDGKIGRDRVVFADFIPNNWSAWPNTYQHIELLEQGPERVVIRTVRDFSQVTITTEYTLESNSDHVVIAVDMKNESQTVLPNLLSGLTLWPNSGYLFGVPGVELGLVGAPTGVSSAGALADRVVAYDETWSVTLHASKFDHLGDESMDLQRTHSLAPGATAHFEGWLQVGSSGDLAPVFRAEIERGGRPFGFIAGNVRGSDGRRVEQPVVVIEKNGRPYGWSLGVRGAYSFTLPTGRYELYATAKNHSQSKKVAVVVRATSHAKVDFGNLLRPGKLQFIVAHTRSDSDAKEGARSMVGGAADSDALDARIRIVSGQKPLVEYLGRSTFFTELEPQGRVEVPIAPGVYRVEVSSGGDFFGKRVNASFTVRPEQTQVARVELTRRFDPTAQGWYSADLHHHADQAEAVTPPADLARSQLAAALSLLFVSDHDSMVNFDALTKIADARHMALLPGMELSPSWGHFNAYPLRSGQKLNIDTSTATVEAVFAEARRLGAMVVQANHPFIPYGYLSSVANGVAPGGFDPGFELLEINAAAPDDDRKVLQALWKQWGEGHRYYLSAGTDTHNVWNDESGVLRVFAHVDGVLDAAGFARSLKEGHAYVSRGPLLYPSILFGDVAKIKPGDALSFDLGLQSVAGLKRVELISGPNGSSAQVDEFAPGTQEKTLHYAVKPTNSTWYSVIAEDVQGRKAYSNPLWIDVVDKMDVLQ